jgi:hypothetical protein
VCITFSRVFPFSFFLFIFFFSVFFLSASLPSLLLSVPTSRFSFLYPPVDPLSSSALMWFLLSLLICSSAASAPLSVSVGGPFLNLALSPTTGAANFSFLLTKQQFSDPTKVELILESNSVYGDCIFSVFVNHGKANLFGPVTLPGVYLVPLDLSSSLPLGATNPISLVPSQGTCNVTVIARLTPSLDLAYEKEGIQYSSIKLPPQGRVFTSTHFSGSAPMNFALNITAPQSIGVPMFPDTGSISFLTPGPCYYDTNEGAVGSPLPGQGPVDMGIRVGGVNGNRGWIIINVAVVQEKPRQLSSSPITTKLIYGLTNFLLVEPSAARSVIKMVLVSGQAPDVEWKANNNTVIGSGVLNENSRVLDVILPPSKIQWLVAFTSQNGGTNCIVQASVSQ